MTDKDTLDKLTRISETLKIIDKTKVSEKYLKDILNDVSEILKEANHPLPFSQRTSDRFDNSNDPISSSKKSIRREAFYLERISEYLQDLDMEIFFSIRDEIYSVLLEALGCSIPSNTEDFFDLLEKIDYSLSIEFDHEGTPKLREFSKPITLIIQIPFKIIDISRISSSLENYISHDNIKHFVSLYKNHNKEKVTCRFDFDPILSKYDVTFNVTTLNNLIDGRKHFEAQLKDLSKDLIELKKLI